MRPFRLAAYHVAGLVSFVALLLSVVALTRNDYVYSPAPSIGGSEPLFESKLGLFQRCDRTIGMGEWKCRRFPKRRLDCPAKPKSMVSEQARQRFSAMMGLRDTQDEYLGQEGPLETDRPHLCELWITAGYLAQLSIPFAAVSTIAAIAYTLPQIRTKKRKQHGWKVCAVLAALHAALQIASTAIIADLWRTSSRFTEGSSLGAAWIMATVSYATSAMLIIGLATAESFGLARSRKKSMVHRGERQPLLSEGSS